RPAEVAEYLLLRAAGLLQGVGQHGEADAVQMPAGQVALLVLTRQERCSAKGRFGSSGVLKELVLEVTGDPSGQLAQFLHEPLELARQLLAVLREPIGIDV